ncbi:cytochrome c550 [Pseudogracilibacillus auburnensis]|uniref:Cytochrome c550 n=1 Tax=Pseudogracilibacillus auburnensis TaxID=1494959 RepID=A0A2V3VX49_9BACI|nr:cytochrome c [Pseudogracilibacillus auburnensis]MBO1003502.1 cytochrome c [Pseudogracilibacillus auburnensis]PXW86512.1 cytochrome c550 [Pseudogracilibacillus auburnensis]
MKKNVLPFGIIAIVGIFVAIIVFYVGVHQRDDIRLAEENGGEEVVEEGEVETDPEAVFANSCAGCHGQDLSGGAGPNLTKVGSELSADEINNIIMNGQGTMPGGLVSKEEADLLTEWLSEMK